MDSEIAKQKLFETMDRIEEIERTSVLRRLSESEKLELANLEVKKMQYYEDWKD